jgi:hypothetical protein
MLALVPTVAAHADEEAEKELCKENDGKWKDNACVFKENEGIDKEQNEVEFEHDLEDKGLWDHSNERLEGYDDDGDRLHVINGDYEDEDEGDD